MTSLVVIAWIKCDCVQENPAQRGNHNNRLIVLFSHYVDFCYYSVYIVVLNMVTRCIQQTYYFRLKSVEFGDQDSKVCIWHKILMTYRRYE